MRNNVAVQTRNRTFSEQDSITVTSFLTKFKPACASSRVQEFAKVLLFKEFLTGPALAAIEVRLTLTSCDANRREGTVMSYEVVINKQLRQ